MEPVSTQAPKAGIHAVSAIKRFCIYKAEEEKQVRVPKLVQDKPLEAIISCWNAFKLTEDGSESLFHECISDYIEGRGIGYSAKDVEKFSIALADMPRKDGFEAKAGVFLSALINCCKAKTFKIHTGNLERPLDFVGYRNRKTIVVEGDAGDFLGCEMQDGKIIVNGNARDQIAPTMQGGEIHILGEMIGSLFESDHVRNGKVYHRGELILGSDD